MKTPDDTATQPGAGQGVEEGARPKSAREAMMERIDERHEEHVAEQIQRQEPAAAAATEGEAVLVDDPKRFKLRVKVGEREEERSLDTVINELQSSQGRLRSLSQRERDLAAALAEKDKLLEQQLAAQLGGAETTDEEIDVRVSEAMAALVEGDEDKASAALKEILRKGRPAATPIDENQLVGKVKAELKAELTREQEQAQGAAVWESFVAEHPEFREQTDPVTGAVILSEERQYGDFVYERDYLPRVEAGEISYQQALSETAQAVRKVFAGQKTDPAPKPKTPFEERQERKRQLDQLPVAAGARAGAEPGAAEESHADTIRQMRQARGLPV